MRIVSIVLLSILAAIFLFPFYKSYPFFVNVPVGQWFAMEWQPSMGSYGFGSSVLGSFYLALLSLPLAMMLGWIFCLQLSQMKSNLAKCTTVALLETWISIPSVVIGVWAIAELVPMIRSISGSGYSVLTASIGLTVFILPTTTLLFFRAYKDYQTQYKQLEESLGLNSIEKTEMFFRTQLGSILSISNYSLCRIFGETMVVLMLSGNSIQIPGSPFEGVRALTATISLEMAYATGNHELSLFALSVVAISLVLLILLPQYKRIVHV